MKDSGKALVKYPWERFDLRKTCFEQTEDISLYVLCPAKKIFSDLFDSKKSSR
jgi:hypothetical protein